MKVICHTNLDLYHEVWPSDLPALPRVGDIIESGTTRRNFRLELQVYSVTFIYVERPLHVDGPMWVPKIELHMCDWMKRLPAKKDGASPGSITAFYEWYAPLVGKSVSSFI